MDIDFYKVDGAFKKGILSNHLVKVCWINGLFLILLLQFGCSETQSHDRSRYYKENYPTMKVEKKNTPMKSDNKNRDTQDLSSETKQDQDKSDTPQTIDPTGDTKLDVDSKKYELNNIKDANSKSLNRKDYNESPLGPIQGFQRQKSRRSRQLVYGYLENPIDQKYADEQLDVTQQTTTTMIEGKLYQLLEDAYQRRDRTEFDKLKKLLLQSFPNTKKQYALSGFEQSFYYQEGLNLTAFQGTMAEINYPAAKSWQDLELYFSLLQRNGVAAIKIALVQQLGEKIFLFSDKKNDFGYYFKSSIGTTADDLFGEIVKKAHANKLKVFASIPVRTHPNLKVYQDFIMDEVWDSVANDTSPSDKLDILNPTGRKYLHEMLQSLLNTSLDGIIFQDDFTYSKNEGFSKAALREYTKETGREIHFNQMFIPVVEEQTGDVDYLTSESFIDYSHWRAGEIRQVLWDLIDLIRKRNKKVLIGLDLTSEMISNSEISIPWYSTSMKLLSDLDIDIFILNQRKAGSIEETDHIEYRKTAMNLREAVAQGKKIYLNVALTEQSQNVIYLNNQMKWMDKLKNDLYDTNIVIGPVDRIKGLDLFNATTVGSSQTSATLQIKQ